MHFSIHEGGETTKTLEYSWSTLEGNSFSGAGWSSRCAVELKSLDICLREKVNMRTCYHLLSILGNYILVCNTYNFMHIIIIPPHHTKADLEEMCWKNTVWSRFGVLLGSALRIRIYLKNPTNQTAEKSWGEPCLLSAPLHEDRQGVTWAGIQS